MKILAINSGSSSVKISLYECKSSNQTFLIEEIRLEWKDDFQSPQLKQGEDVISIEASTYQDALTIVIDSFTQKHAIDAICHRIVHGKDLYRQSTLIDESVKQAIRTCSDLAPLHNQSDLLGIETLEKRLPNTPQIAVFDTAFHATLPDAAAIYPGPYKWVQEKIRRYGFHGISYQYCTKKVQKMAPKAKKSVLCHLGSGASLCATLNGKSIDTTMGFTPLEGLMMETRSGTIDPGALLYLLKNKTAQELSDELYRKSGLLGIAGISGDMKEILKRVASKDVKATLALEIYLHRLNQSIGSMIASLQGIDVLVFTGGIGEKASLIREKVCETFAFLGCDLNREKNMTSTSQDSILSTKESKVTILLIHTQEALEMAEEAFSLLQKQL